MRAESATKVIQFGRMWKGRLKKTGEPVRALSSSGGTENRILFIANGKDDDLF
jgi:hypothetical protein